MGATAVVIWLCVAPWQDLAELQRRAMEGELPQVVRELAALPSPTADHWMLLAYLQENLGDYEGAIHSAEQILAERPGDFDAQLRRAYCEWKRGRTVRAETLIRTLLADLEQGDPRRAGVAAALEQLAEDVQRNAALGPSLQRLRRGVWVAWFLIVGMIGAAAAWLWKRSERGAAAPRS